MTYKEIISELHQALQEGSGTMVPLNGTSPPEHLVLMSGPTLVGTTLPSKKQIGAFTWENRRRRAFKRPNAVLWAVKDGGEYRVGIAASVNIKVAARAARLRPGQVVRLG